MVSSNDFIKIPPYLLLCLIWYYILCYLGNIQITFKC
uniref:Uncharacterized protein n=1 Tax=Siphoviridae sp. ctnpt50 TaxID=2827941 RepID=A0A8S5SEB1_9CAUD|nr:MAG TPA: hypothetical protein [Siphoviridae sp. ctnpt50]